MDILIELAICVPVCATICEIVHWLRHRRFEVKASHWSIAYEEHLVIGGKIYTIKHVDLPEDFRPSCLIDGVIFVEQSLDLVTKRAALLHEADEIILHVIRDPVVEQIIGRS